MSQISRISRRSLIAAAGAAAMTVSAGAALADESTPAGAPSGGPLLATATTEPYSGEDDVARVDENGDTVYYSMRRNWVDEAPSSTRPTSPRRLTPMSSYWAWATQAPNASAWLARRA